MGTFAAHGREWIDLHRTFHVRCGWTPCPRCSPMTVPPAPEDILDCIQLVWMSLSPDRHHVEGRCAKCGAGVVARYEPGERETAEDAPSSRG